MRAVVYEAFQQPLVIRNVADPTPQDDGVVISVQASGLCRSDWHGWMGHDHDIQLPHVPGHEFAGVVAEAGRDVKNWREGDRVTVPFSVGCGVCPPCQQGDHQICDDYFQPGFTAWGSFAERVAIPHADLNLVRLPDSMTFEVAASLGCRLVTAFRAIINQGRLQADQWLAVFGCGGVGLSAIMIAQAIGANVIGIDVQPSAMRVATTLGARHVIDSSQTDPVAAIDELTSGGVHLTLDALGSPAIGAQAIACLRKRGRHVQVGLLAGEDVALPLDQVVAKELEIIGSHGMSAQAYQPLMEMIQRGTLQPAKLVSRHVKLDDVPRLLPEMQLNQHQGITVVRIGQLESASRPR